MKRIMIVGQPGSGKSTLARLLHKRTGLPFHYMDHIHHKPDWEPRPLWEKIELCRKVTDQESWIFEGGLSSTYPTRLHRADTMIWIDIPVGVRFWRVLRRTIRHYGTNRPDLPKGCIERFDREAMLFWKWIWDTRRSARAKIEAMAGNPRGTRVVHLTSLKEVNAWLASLPCAPYLSDTQEETPDARPIGDRRTK